MTVCAACQRQGHRLQDNLQGRGRNNQSKPVQAVPERGSGDVKHVLYSSGLAQFSEREVDWTEAAEGALQHQGADHPGYRQASMG